MWFLKSVKATNLMSFSSLNYNVKQGVTTLVFGENKDNESQKSNGSGKSALTEAIVIGLIGSPLRKIKNEEIINDSSEECEVYIVLENSAKKEQLHVWRNFFRKESSSCEVKLYRDGDLIKRMKQTNQASMSTTSIFYQNLG